MDAGSVVELDHPHVLLQKKKGILTGMVDRTGAGMAENLKKIAREVCLQFPFATSLGCFTFRITRKDKAIKNKQQLIMDLAKLSTCFSY